MSILTRGVQRVLVLLTLPLKDLMPYLFNGHGDEETLGFEDYGAEELLEFKELGEAFALLSFWEEEKLAYKEEFHASPYKATHMPSSRRSS